ncbi:3-hydroxybutyryl-CoA dehydrogenase [Sporomusa termitida]|uniref:3-hydroxybutyryl-CoA dehydrogenase n=1 Tax=Sporomusa termitida TaxID=2377 RepID=A0A517DSE1_9FIRM|nr:3-hydroxybutyryl-CoA dehydrogenase [Sporomusa termitida]QDR80273.1 3-hydroxybutyryl-CoA dehydrogenase [Sporomusa termitida]
MEIKKIFVIGAGLMGAGIAQVAIQSGYDVILNDISESTLANGATGIEERLNRSVAKGFMSHEEKDACMKRLTCSMELASAAECQFVIEAIYENFEAKRAVFEKLDVICPPETILSSNTSSISLTALSSVVKRPEKFIGMHFFSPVPVMKLLEIIRGLRTSEDTLSAAREVGERLEKVMVVAKDMPGFIVNRILIPMLNEAVQILDESIGTVEDIDNGMKCGCNHPMGPLALADMVGLDVLLAAIEVFYSELGDSKYRPAPLLRKMVKAGYLGRKSGAGFYLYEAGGKKLGVNPVLNQ